MQNNSKYYLITNENYLIKILIKQIQNDERNLQIFIQQTSQKTRYVLVRDLR